MTDLELREKVATLVMGLSVRVIKNDDDSHAGEWVRCYDGGSWCKDYLGDGGLVVDHENDMSREVPHYESDIAAAWLVVERMRELGWLWEFGPSVAGWYVQLCEDLGDEDEGEWEASHHGKELPPLICRAALAAVEAT